MPASIALVAVYSLSIIHAGSPPSSPVTVSVTACRISGDALTCPTEGRRRRAAP